MPIALTAALAVSMATVPTCSWDRPGANPFVGDVVAAVDRYTDIPEPVRATLKKRMAARQYDEIAVIRRDAIAGKRRYGAEIRDMHFGNGQVCRTVTRAKWQHDALERGLVYCEAGHCIIVPTVCRNVSRINRLGNEEVASAGEPGLPHQDFRLPGGRGGGVGGAGDGAAGGDTSPSMRILSEGIESGPGAASAGGPGFDAVTGFPDFTLSSLDAGVGLAGFSPASAGGSAAGIAPATAPGSPGSFSEGAVGNSVLPGVDAANNGASRLTGGSGNTDLVGQPPLSPSRGGGGGGGAAAVAELGSNVVGTEVTAIPEPATWALWLLGLAGLLALRKRL